MKNSPQSIERAYARAAADYARTFRNELDGKPFERLLLSWLAERLGPAAAVMELGCGSGEVTAYLASRGISCLGTDFAAAMVAEARRAHPECRFEEADFLALPQADATQDLLLAWYAIVNLEEAAISRCLAEAFRVLVPGGRLALAFHAYDGQAGLELTEFFGIADNPLAFYYHDPDLVARLALAAGFRREEQLERRPYEGREYPTRRAYLILEKPAAGPEGD